MDRPLFIISILAFVACGSPLDPSPPTAGGSAPNAGGSSGSGGGTGGSTTAGGTAGGQSTLDGGLITSRRDQLYTSGSRIKVKVVVGEDGSKFQLGLFDTQLQTLCSYAVAGDGVMRCIPAGAGFASYFSDPQCMQRVVSVIPCGPAPRFATVFTETCPVRYESFSVTSSKSANLYGKSGASCSSVTVAGYEHYLLGARIEPSTMVRGAETME